MCACVGWCARGLVSPSLPLSQLSHIASPHVCLCWMVRPPFRRLVFPFCLPLSRHMCAFVGWGLVLSACVGQCACLPEVLSPLVSCLPCLRTRVPVFDGASAFTTSCLPFLSPIVTPHVCACDGMSAWWHFRLPEVLSPLASHCLPTIYVCVGWCVRLHKVLSRLVSSIVSHLPSCFPFLDGVPAFSRSCLPGLHVSPIVPHSLPLSPHMCACFGWCVRLPQLFSPLLSHWAHCLPLSPIVCPHLCLCWMARPPFRRLVFPFVSPHVCLCWVGSCLVCLCWTVCPPSRGLVSPCLPHVCLCWMVPQPWMVCPPSRGLVSSCLPVLDGVSAFPRSCFPLSPISLLVSLCWMVCPPSRRLASCLPLSPHMRACVRWFVRFPKVLSPLVFHCLPLSAQLPPIVSLLVSPSPVVSGCVSLFPIVSPHVCLCWMVCPSSEVLSPHCLPLFPRIGVPPIWIISAFKRPCLPMSPIVSPHVCLCWMLCPPSRGLVSFRLPLSPIVSPHVCLCWTVCPTSQGLVSPCLLLFPHMCACNVLCWMVRPPSRGFVSLLVSHCLPSCFPVLDGVSAFPRFCLPCLPACLWAGLPSCLPSLSPNLSVFLFPFVVGGLILHFFSTSVLLGVLSAFLRCPPWCWMLCPPSRCN